MIFLILGVLAVVFFLSLLAYKKVRSKTKSKFIEWISWLIFSIWTLAFALCGMSFIKNSYPDLNKVLAIVPIALAVIVFIFGNRKNISTEGFNKKDL